VEAEEAGQASSFMAAAAWKAARGDTQNQRLDSAGVIDNKAILALVAAAFSVSTDHSM
jgi:hypothetical protein